MKLCVIHINAETGSGPYTAQIDGIFNKVKQPETQIVHRYARLKRAGDTVYSYPYLLNKIDVLHQFMDADREDFDGAMVACSGDPGVAEARSLANMSIVGPMEATLHLACSYAYKFGIVTVKERGWAEVCDMLVASNGLTSRFIGVERIGIASPEAFAMGFGDGAAAVAAEIEKKARALVERGATAVVLGSAGLSCIASHAGLSTVPGTSVPIFDVLSVGLKTLEMRVELTKALGLPVTSRGGYMEQFPAKDADRVRKLFGM